MSNTKVQSFDFLPKDLFYEIFKRCLVSDISRVCLISKKYLALVSSWPLILQIGPNLTLRNIYQIGFKYGIKENLTIHEMVLFKVGFIHKILEAYQKAYPDVFLKQHQCLFEKFKACIESLNQTYKWLESYVYETFNEPELDIHFIQFLYVLLPEEIDWLDIIVESKNRKLLNLFLTFKANYRSGSLYKMINLNWEKEYIQKVFNLYKGYIETEEKLYCTQSVAEKRISNLEFD